jgi:electron transfer flavoprotein alpha subunit
MNTALILIENNKGQIKKSSLECLSALAGAEMKLFTFGLADTTPLVEQLKAWGVTKHFTAKDPSLEKFNPESFLQLADQALSECNADILIASSNTHGRDVFPRLAARKDCAYMSDITELSFSNGLVAKRPLYAGKCLAQVTFTDESKKIILLRPNQVPTLEPQESGNTELVELNLKELSGKVTTLSIEAGESEKLDLTEAATIVSGGRGLKEAENFKLLEDLAAPLNATVGASRAVVDLGWVPHSQQVGQTGKTVAPTLYIAVGISGAIQHLAGMSGSKNIVAINKDDKAPIFQKANYGIVGDLFEVVPLLTEKLKSIR